MQVTKRFRFDAAHHLPGYPGKCARVHGHGYELEVTVEGPIRPDGLVYDFYDLKTVVRERVVDRLDHQDLNDFFAMPSAENVAAWIWGELTDLPLAQIRLYETPDSWVTVRPGDVPDRPSESADASEGGAE